MKRIKLSLVIITLILTMSSLASAIELELNSQSACLMEVTTGKILYEKNADERLEPASVTKIMSLILVFEAMDEGKFTLETPVYASEHACSMGGSQIWLEPGESLTVHEMLKAVAVASANDCTVALGELVAGSEESFVAMMNDRAKELLMNNTHFVNCTGLPAPDHYTTARDIAIMTRELYKHKAVFDYTKIWMDTLRGGEFGITNTNKLVRFYNGATGMKTGYTSSAQYCMSATAEKNGMNLIAAVMKSESSDKRFADARKLLDYGFANYCIYKPERPVLDNIHVNSGKKREVEVEAKLCDILLEKGKENKMEKTIKVEKELSSPIKKGEKVGEIVYSIDGETISSFPVVTTEEVEKMSLFDVFSNILLSSITMR